ncbi:MAG: ATP-binding protein, partial [Candidatus Hydrogenedentes bacterium]|nr:ATP-binding protein [Candidatus Hydrogenedentota bacterium]
MEIEAFMCWSCINGATSRVTFSDIAGLDGVKARLCETITCPSRRAEAQGRITFPHHGSFLLYGPKGNGKTSIAVAFAGELNAPLFTLHSPPARRSDRAFMQTSMQELLSRTEEYERSVVLFDNADG